MVNEHEILKKLNEDHDTREKQMEEDAVEVIANEIDQRIKKQHKLRKEQEQEAAALAIKKETKRK
eukprot:UN00578